MISVVLPVYNGAAFLGEAIESMLAQTESDFEFLVLDDASTDGSADIARAYARLDARIRVIADKCNRGITARLNQALALTTRPLIARMDADDISEPTRLEKQRAFLDANHDVVLVGTRVLLIDPEGAPLMEMGDALTHDEIDEGLLNGRGQLVYHPSVMFHAEAARAVGGYDESFRVTSDLDFFLRLAEIGRLANLPEALLRYRQHFDSAGYARVAEQERAIDESLRRARLRRAVADVESPAPPRPRRAPRTRAATYRIWGWWALTGGNIATARKYAFKALAGDPLDRETMKLVFCALRGH